MRNRVVVFVALVMFGLVFLPAGFSARAQEKKDEAKTAVAVDAAFLETLADYQMITREIERIEAASGTVEIPVSVAQLRQRAEGKMGKIRAWMKEHAVGEDWSYDSQARAFRAAAPKAEPKK